MPFESKAQEREMWANQPQIARRWEKETPNRENLPEHVKHSQISGDRPTHLPINFFSFRGRF